MALSGSALAATIPAPPVALAGGWWIFLIFVFVALFALIFGYYTVRGSGINLRPYRRAGEASESPPQLAHDITSDVRTWERGTEGHRRPNEPPSPQVPIDPKVAEALKEWRASDTRPRLDPPIGPADHVHGPEGAQTVTLYVDMDAEPCRSVIRVVRELSQQRPVRLAIRHLPLADVHSLALPAAEALEASAAQGRFFETLDVLAQAGFSTEEELLARISQSVPDPERLRNEVREARFRTSIVEHIRRAMTSGVQGVPELFIDDKHYGDALTRESLGAALDGRGWRAGSLGPKSEI